MAINTREELEEERRLFYVAITRAKKKLWLTHANTRYRYGQLHQNDPSRFIDEIPEEYVDKSYSGSGMNKPIARNFSQERPAYERPKPASNSSGSGVVSSILNNRPKAKEHVPSADFEASDTADLQAGQKVEHQKFGYGVIAKMEGAAHNPIATIQFELSGEKKIMLNYAKLRIVETGA
jgi:DNA helicase-2/ATP-dependent DNA helicase PcrA